MATHEIIVTDVTCYGTLYCVAGWDTVNQRMIRPEPSSANVANEASRFWDSQFAGVGRPFSVGNIVRFEASAPPNGFPFPHATEDLVVDVGTSPRVLGHLTLVDVAEAVAAGVAPNLEEAFGGALVRASSGKAHVPAGHVGPSLSAIEKNPGEISFYENTYDPNKRKLRAIVVDAGASYDLSVTADAVRTSWKAGGINGLDADLAASNRVHVRLGLSRPFAAMPNECFLQVNGLYLL